MTGAILPHVAFAREILDEAPPGLPYPFVRRAQVAALPSLPDTNSIEAPAYLMDMGLRRWRDPRSLFRATLDTNIRLKRRWGILKSKQPERLAYQAREWEADRRSTDEISADFETLTIFTGDDAVGWRFAELLDSSVRPVDTPRLAASMATMLSIDEAPKAYRLLQRAAELTSDPVSHFLVDLRILALLIKRLHDYAGAQSLIKDLTRVASGAVRDYVVSEADGEGMRVLLLNLRALIEVREERYFDAVTTMERAQAQMPDDGFVKVPSDMADRYRAQVRINVAQALWISGRESEAVTQINRHASITRAEHPYSLSEALLVAAYFNELSGHHSLSLSYCLEAERLLAREGVPTRLAMCRRIAVAALNGVGKRGRAEKLARAIPRDPLGERFLV
ncbi:MAG: hypothetical protein LBJ62_03670 [Bifidobacteriaceae bacterium]|jgi:hypothetical protein|nr:hypothetical protein [Bifidobacteriaceae bacterium]